MIWLNIQEVLIPLHTVTTKHFFSNTKFTKIVFSLHFGGFRPRNYLMRHRLILSQSEKINLWLSAEYSETDSFLFINVLFYIYFHISTKKTIC